MFAIASSLALLLVSGPMVFNLLLLHHACPIFHFPASTPYINLLHKLSNISRLCYSESSVTHSMTHHILTAGPSVFCYACHLAPDHPKIINLNLITCSSLASSALLTVLGLLYFARYLNLLLVISILTTITVL